jgi:hypothetical protein
MPTGHAVGQVVALLRFVFGDSTPGIIGNTGKIPFLHDCLPPHTVLSLKVGSK